MCKKKGEKYMRLNKEQQLALKKAFGARGYKTVFKEKETVVIKKGFKKNMDNDKLVSMFQLFK